MIIDYKYHIASLVAVFLALGIGIIIGSTMLGNDALIEYQKQVTNRLETQLQSLRETNVSIQAKASALEIDSGTHKQFEKTVLPALVTKRLEGQKFALLTLNTFGFPPETTGIINDSGGQVTSVTSLSDFYDQPEILNKFVTAMGWPEAVPEQQLGKFAAALAAGISKGDGEAFFTVLTDQEILKKSGDYGVPLNGVIIVGGCYGEKKRDPQLDLLIIDSFRDLNIPVVCVEETDVSLSYIKDYQRKSVSTVDNIDTAPGQLALVLALGGQPGNYGVKSTAQMLLPALNTN